MAEDMRRIDIEKEKDERLQELEEKLREFENVQIELNEYSGKLADLFDLGIVDAEGKAIIKKDNQNEANEEWKSINDDMK